MNADPLMKLAPASEYRHPRVSASVRIGVAVWLLILTAILYGSDRGGWWALLLVPGAAVHVFLALRLPRAIRARTNSTDGRSRPRG